MFHLTRQERLVLTSLAAVLFLGTFLSYVYQKNPHLADVVNVIENDRVYPKVNVNRATQHELMQVPYIGQYTANQIVQYREKYGPFTDLRELRSVKGIRLKNFEKFKKYLIIRPK